MKLGLFAAAAALLTAPVAFAQHAHPTPPAAPTPDPHARHGEHDNGSHPAPAVEVHAGHDMAVMTGFYGPYPMAREASGTAWQPEAAGMGGLHLMRGDWSLMGHALLNLTYTDQSGPRGDDMTFVSGMVMGMASRPFAGGTLGFRGMVSPDPFMGAEGYPLLLATGETADGVHPLIDRQHPHELINELAVTYSRPIGGGASVFGYAAAVGEPAFGPPAFMHRASGMDNPLAPISHHWLDSTHVTFGVLTGGVTVGGLKLDASAFRGREPDEDRYDIEAPRLDSWSARATLNPSPEWSLQASYADQSAPEQLEPEVDVRRASLSAAYARRLADGGALNATVAWGRRDPSEGESVDAWLAEAAWSPDERWTLFARGERVEQNELLEDHHGEGHGHGEAFDVGQLTLGVVHDWSVRPGVRVGVGAAYQLYAIPAELDPFYGEARGATVFLRLRAM